MQRKTISFFTLIALGLVLIGCNRGCTTSHTIASESTTIATSGGNVEIVGRVIDYRHSRRIGNNIFERSISHSFGLSFDLNYGVFKQTEFYHEGVDDPDLVDLPSELKRVKVMISDDKNHIGLGVDGKVVDLIHLYKSSRIATGQDTLTADGTLDWSNLDINSFPSPASILTENLKNDCGKISNSEEALYAFCNASKPSDRIHRIMLDQMPTCNVANNYLTEEKIQELSKSKKWKKYAIKRGKKVLDEIGSNKFEFDEALNFIVAMNSHELNSRLDKLLMKEWGPSGGSDYTKYLVKRLEQKKNPMGNTNRDAIHKQAKSEFQKFQKTGKLNYKREASKCLQVLSSLGDTTVGFEFVQNSFGVNISRFETSDFLDVAYEDFDVFTDYQQRLIVQKTEPLFEHMQGYSRSIAYLRIMNIVDCGMLKRLKKKYQKDLGSMMTPHRCNP